ncbi:MAG: hypothetical protein AB7O96_06230 [Pseudobdellovibrionaceae bacterium]
MAKFGVSILVLVSSLMPNLVLGDPAVKIEGRSFDQKKISWIWSHRQQFIQSCLMDKKVCGKSDGLVKVLQKISGDLKSSRADQIHFVSERERPDFFTSDKGEVHRIAVTENRPGSPIYFNTDLIAGLSIEKLSAVIFHELAHHAGLNDDATRLPDHIGARVAQHIGTQLKTSYLDQQEMPHLVAGVFQFAIPEYIDGTNSFGNFGFITDGNVYIDLNFIDFVAFPACDNPNEEPLGQMIDNPLRWTFSSPNKISVETPIRNFCVWVDREKRTAGSNVALRGFSMKFEIDAKQLINTETVVTTLADQTATYIDPTSTLELMGVELDKASYVAGDIVRAKVKVKNFNPFPVKRCEVAVTHEDAPKQDNGWPVMVSFESTCKQISQEKNISVLDVAIKVPASAQSGRFSIAVIKVVGEGPQEVAFGTFFKNEISFAVVGSSAGAAMSVMSISAPRAQKLDKLGPYPLKDSFIYRESSNWLMEIVVQSVLPIQLRGFSANFFIVKSDGSITGISQSGAPKDLTHYIKSLSYEGRSSNTQVIKIEISLPKKLQNLDVFGLVFEGLFLEDSAGRLLRFEKKDPYQYFFLSERVVNRAGGL